MSHPMNYGVVVPMANEEERFQEFLSGLRAVLDGHPHGAVYLVVDRASRDRTHDLCMAAAKDDGRIHCVWAPENRNVVDAYLRGFRAAIEGGHDYIIEMDAGMSHDPAAIPLFLEALRGGKECAFGSRYIEGGSSSDTPFRRMLFSRGGTLLARYLLGCRMKDATSGFEGFRREVLESLLSRPLKSKAHFYQTEVRYLLRQRDFVEVPIHYRSPSPRVSMYAVVNSIQCLGVYFLRRVAGSRDQA